jgi:NTE family protein
METTPSQSLGSIGLALSGGGVRAAAFHAGVLKGLAQQNLLEEIVHISTVSGGSLITGLVFHHANYAWPSSEAYLSKIFPAVRKVLTTTSLQWNAFLRLFNPLNWRHLTSRANIVAQSIRSHWGITATLAALPAHPVWSINATTAETGHRFRFKKQTLGEYAFGYAQAESFGLASAMAVSAAFPPIIGPLRVSSDRYEWRKRESWSSEKPPERAAPPYKTFHLYDGGVYDNLGLEPLFDSGKQTIKLQDGKSVAFLIVSDAGAPQEDEPIPGPLNPFRLRRLANIAFNQCRALRVRSFVNFLLSKKGDGLYIQIGATPREPASGAITGTAVSLSGNWLTPQEFRRASHFKTTLQRLDDEQFDLLARHGYETLSWSQCQRAEEFGKKNTDTAGPAV